MPQVYKDRILKFLKREEYQPLKLAQLAKALGVDEDAYPAFKVAFDELRQAGHVVIGAGNVDHAARHRRPGGRAFPRAIPRALGSSARWSRTPTATCSSRPTAPATP